AVPSARPVPLGDAPRGGGGGGKERGPMGVRSAMTRRALLTVLAFLGVGIAPVAAQSGGAIAGRVQDAVSGRPLEGVLIVVDSGPRGAVSDAAGSYRIREVHSGWHRVRASQIGYRGAERDSVLVQAGDRKSTRLNSSHQIISYAVFCW